MQCILAVAVLVASLITVFDPVRPVNSNNNTQSMVTHTVGISNVLTPQRLLTIWGEGAGAISTLVPFVFAFRGHRENKVILTHEVLTP